MSKCAIQIIAGQGMNDSSVEILDPDLGSRFDSKQIQTNRAMLVAEVWVNETGMLLRELMGKSNAELQDMIIAHIRKPRS